MENILVIGRDYTSVSLDYFSNGQYTMKSIPVINKKEYMKMPNNSKPGVSVDLYVW